LLHRYALLPCIYLIIKNLELMLKKFIVELPLVE